MGRRATCPRFQLHISPPAWRVQDAAQPELSLALSEWICKGTQGVYRWRHRIAGRRVIGPRRDQRRTTQRLHRAVHSGRHKAEAGGYRLYMGQVVLFQDADLVLLPRIINDLIVTVNMPTNERFERAEKLNFKRIGELGFHFLQELSAVGAFAMSSTTIKRSKMPVS